jgi:type I restriction enzyme S subunit
MPYDDKNDGLMEYLAYFFQSAFYNSFCKTITNKSGQAFWNISREKLLKLAIPLPPLAEQQRIVAKIEELFEQIDKITK